MDATDDMAARASRLLAWQVPDAEMTVTPQRAALYALSIGIGSDPLDTAALRFVDPARRDFTAFPSMALILGYPGFWLGEPALGIGSANILHIEQSFELLRPLPVAGRVRGTTRIDGLRDRGAGRGSVLSSSREIFNDTGELVARVSQKHLLRGLSGYAPGDAQPAAPRTGPESSALAASSFATRRDQALLYRLNGDMNALHADPEVARAAGFRAPILHGMCSFGIAAWALARHLAPGDPARLVSMSARFTAPVVPGETLVTEIFEESRFRTLIGERDVPALDAGLARFAPAAGETVQ
ncbi:MaoC/PaaZ C-terminal domain-containing protein [Sphingopyxis sp.]|jgi:hypothetical protein|uniref:MaoC/PaaZ C-terminal domain-containing protein n=1 Tax=Sphingopyxis sp. TaxID=1908224 RepID=UPI002DE6E69C|nr:MaoC/PaaZ C-terminal domain-containing protein [Sphingopyxis sp.]